MLIMFKTITVLVGATVPFSSSGGVGGVGVGLAMAKGVTVQAGEFGDGVEVRVLMAPQHCVIRHCISSDHRLAPVCSSSFQPIHVGHQGLAEQVIGGGPGELASEGNSHDATGLRATVKDSLKKLTELAKGNNEGAGDGGGIGSLGLVASSALNDERIEMVRDVAFCSSGTFVFIFIC